MVNQKKRKEKTEKAEFIIIVAITTINIAIIAIAITITIATVAASDRYFNSQIKIMGSAMQWTLKLLKRIWFSWEFLLLLQNIQQIFSPPRSSFPLSKKSHKLNIQINLRTLIYPSFHERVVLIKIAKYSE